MTAGGPWQFTIRLSMRGCGVPVTRWMARPPDFRLPWPEQPPTLTDGVVTLRALQAEDADAVYRACQDEQIQRYTQVPVPYRRSDAIGFVTEISTQLWSSQLGAPLAVTSASTGELLAACGLVGVEAQQRRSGAGYWVAPWARGHGVAGRALGLVTDWALGDGGLDHVFVEIEPENVASLAVAAAAQFRSNGGRPIMVELRGVPREYVVLIRDRDPAGRQSDAGPAS
jgi:RimJ/RimL family protein N-acetyltransferase